MGVTSILTANIFGRKLQELLPTDVGIEAMCDLLSDLTASLVEAFKTTAYFFHPLSALG